MKKTISLFLSIIISVATVLFCAGNIYSATAEKSSINSFIEEGVNLIRENDAGKEFVPEVVIDEETNDEKSSDSLLRKYAVGSTETDNTSIENEGFSDTAFQTCRLIVRASKSPDKLNSIGMASGFKDWYIIQFETEDEAKSAYNYYAFQDGINKVFPDMVCETILDSTDYKESRSDDRAETNESLKRLNSWGSVETGLYDIKDYIESNGLDEREIVVGVVDTGIDNNLSFFEDRIIRYCDTYLDGYEYNDIYHGTQVSAMIVDNTSDNIKIAMYQFSQDGTESAMTSPWLCFLEAVNDDVDMINCSFVVPNILNLYEMWEDALEYANNKEIAVFAGAGNSPERIWGMPAKSESVYTVAAYGANGLPCSWTSYGKEVDFLAPGEDIPTVYMEGEPFDTASGTSFSCPLVVSEFALLLTMFPDKSNKQIADLMKKTCKLTDEIYDYAMYGCGVIDAVEASGIKRNKSPQFSIPEGKCIGDTEVEITADPDCEIYYTLDGSYPSEENGTLYTTPVILSDGAYLLKAVAYGNGLFRSECVKSRYRIQHIGTDDMFEISEDGQITEYTGNRCDLILPETIKGIIVTGIASSDVFRTKLTGITFPDTMTEVPNLIFKNNTLKIADGYKIESIGEKAFENCENLCHINFPSVKEVGYGAFMGNPVLKEVILPECSNVSHYAFNRCESIRYISLPKIENIGVSAFEGCKSIWDMNISNVSIFQERAVFGSRTIFDSNVMMPLDLPYLKQVTIRAFNNSSFSRIELSNVESINSSPNEFSFINLKCIVLPSTLNNCNLSVLAETAVIYGSCGTYAEQWANENGYQFTEITPETAIINDLPNFFVDNMHYLYADVVGFNRKYQWYGSNTGRNTGGILIEGANERRFVPKDKAQFPFYYCVITSTDVGYEPIEIRTGVSRYLQFDGEIPPADYTELDETITTIPQDLNIYTNETVSALNEIIRCIDRNLDATEQDTVDGYVEALTDAIANLKLKEYTVSFIADGETILEYDLEYAKEISMIPPAPAKEGYTFKEWLPDIPETMPAKDISFYAVFEENKQPDNKPNGEIKPLIDIRGFEYACTIDYRTTITFTAITKDMPKDATVVWYKDGQKAGEGDKFTVKEAKEAFTVQTKVADKTGNVLNSTETELVKVKSDFLSRIIAFFRALFKRLPVIEQ